MTANINMIQSPLAQAIESTLGSSGANRASGARFGEMMSEMLAKTSKSQDVSQNLTERLQLDDPTVSVESTVLASNEASLNFEFTLQTRNKLMKAYQDLMSMPV
ncbi:flagellar hook-basal body complex protein FliE [Candidatus Saccharibacteria bacterium]|nr:flagellar hook-basal body complex protein FliE [Candidatus Saccharibacteria bacterium]|tara:strand:- start:1485 stop:1796 length:312 start_codon:yes stop_codon:yes gene_type:complete